MRGLQREAEWDPAHSRANDARNNREPYFSYRLFPYPQIPGKQQPG